MLEGLKIITGRARAARVGDGRRREYRAIKIR